MKTKSKKTTTKKTTSSRSSKSTKLHHRAHAHAKTHFTRYFAGLAVLTLMLSLSLLGTTEARDKTPKTGTVKISAYYTKCKYSNKKFDGAVWNANTEKWQKCKGTKGSKASLYVTGGAGSGKCAGKQTSMYDSIDLGRRRTIKCEPGHYNFYLNDSQDVKFSCRGDTCTAHKSISVDVKSKVTYNFNLGSGKK